MKCINNLLTISSNHGRKISTELAEANLDFYRFYISNDTKKY